MRFKPGTCAKSYSDSRNRSGGPACNVLNLLGDQPAGMQASDLAAALVVAPSNIIGLLKRMGRVGYLKELASPGDARLRIVTLNPKGRRLWQKTKVRSRRIPAGSSKSGC